MIHCRKVSAKNLVDMAAPTLLLKHQFIHPGDQVSNCCLRQSWPSKLAKRRLFCTGTLPSWMLLPSCTCHKNLLLPKNKWYKTGILPKIFATRRKLHLLTAPRVSSNLSKLQLVLKLNNFMVESKVQGMTSTYTRLNIQIFPASSWEYYWQHNLLFST